MTAKALLATGLLLAAGTVFAQTPTVEVKGAGMQVDATGAVQFIVHPNGAKVAGATFELQFPAESAASIALGSPTGTAPTGFDNPAVTNPSAGRIVYVTATSDGMGVTTDPLVFTLNLTNKLGAGLKGLKFTLVGYDDTQLTGSNIALEDLSTIGIATAAFSIVNGASRNLPGAMNNTVSVAPGVIAAVAGSTLWLLDPANPGLAPLPGAAAGTPLAAPISGRPAFGSIDGVLAVAVGSDDGTLAVVKTTDGSKAEYKGDFTSATTPAIAADGVVYVAGKTATGAQVASVKVTGGTAVLGNVAPITGATDVQSSPAVAGNTLVVGTNNSVFYANVDAAGVITPRTNTAPTGVAFNTSPVVSGAFAFIGDATGKVHKIALANGDATVSTATLPAPLSDPFAMGGKVHFGVGDGRVATFATGDVATDPTFTAVGTTPVVQPVDTGTLVVAGTQAGIIVAGANSVDLGPTLGKAIAVLPGTTPTIVVNKVDGTVYAMPAQ